MNEIPKYGKMNYKIYYSNDYEGYIIDYYENKSFPLNGWLKPCLICNHISSKFEKYKIIHTDEVLIICLCRLCQNKEKKEKYKYIANQVDRVIISNYLEDIFTNGKKFKRVKKRKRVSSISQETDNISKDIKSPDNKSPDNKSCVCIIS